MPPESVVSAGNASAINAQLTAQESATVDISAVYSSVGHRFHAATENGAVVLGLVSKQGCRLMIVWLASYPRSGNTMLRTILRQSFGTETYSIYDDKTDIAKSSTVSALVGHRSMGMKAPDFVRQSKTSSDLRFIKTHSPPLDASPAIYIVRDGRAAVISYFRYLRDVRERADVELRDVIEGRNVYFSSWSGSLREWNPQVRPKTLLLRYEDIIDDAQTAIARVGEFIGLSPVSVWENEFEKMRMLYPEFFRAGSNEKNIAALEGSDLERFWMLHGEMMRSMRYG